MLKSILIKTAIASLMLGSITASANEVVDLFTTDQAILTAGSGSTPEAKSTVEGIDIIGGERDIKVVAGTTVKAEVEVFGGQMIIASNNRGGTSDSNFSVEVQWDGKDADADNVDTNGLSPSPDFSNLNGFSAEIFESDGTGAFDVTIWDTAGAFAVLNLGFSPVSAGSPVTFGIAFSLFKNINPALDLSSIGAISLKLATVGKTDITIEAIRAVPAPSSLAILGLGLLGFAGFSRRKA